MITLYSHILLVLPGPLCMVLGGYSYVPRQKFMYPVLQAKDTLIFDDA